MIKVLVFKKICYIIIFVNEVFEEMLGVTKEP